MTCVLKLPAKMKLINLYMITMWTFFFRIVLLDQEIETCFSCSAKALYNVNIIFFQCLQALAIGDIIRIKTKENKKVYICFHV